MGAANATLTFMAGGDGAAVKEAETVLLHMGKSVVHCGASGAGQVAS
jgi:3-hydroxyisobutyrate dehydrogenase